MERLIKNEILLDLDFMDLYIYVDCIKRKQTEHTKKWATRNTQLLKIVHTDICGPFDVSSFGKKRYFIIFIDYYSRYGYVYLLHEKCQAVDALEIYLNEVERQLDWKVKIIRFDRGGEYYERYDQTRQHPSPLLSFFKNVAFVCNTQCLVHHNKMVYQKGVIEL